MFSQVTLEEIIKDLLQNKERGKTLIRDGMVTDILKDGREEFHSELTQLCIQFRRKVKYSKSSILEQSSHFVKK